MEFDSSILTQDIYIEKLNHITPISIVKFILRSSEILQYITNKVFASNAHKIQYINFYVQLYNHLINIC